MQSARHWTSSRRVNRSSRRNGTQLWDRICTASETPADRVSTSLLANSCNSFLVVTSQEQQQIKTTSWLYRRTPITQSSAAGARTLAMSKMGRANQLTGKKIMLLFPVTACKNIKLCPSWSILQTDSKSPCAFPTSRVYRITMALETVLAADKDAKATCTWTGIHIRWTGGRPNLRPRPSYHYIHPSIFYSCFLLQSGRQSGLRSASAFLEGDSRKFGWSKHWQDYSPATTTIIVTTANIKGCRCGKGPHMRDFTELWCGGSPCVIFPKYLGLLIAVFVKPTCFHWTYCISCTTTVCTRLTDTHLIWPSRAAEYHISSSEGRCGTQHVNAHLAALCYIQSFAAECVRTQPQGMHDNCLNVKLRITLSVRNSKLICNNL